MMQSPIRDKVQGVSADKQKQPDLAPVPEPIVVEQEPIQEPALEPNIDIEKQDIPHHPLNDTSIESTLVRNDEQITKLNQISKLINTVLKSNPNKDSIKNNQTINNDIALLTPQFDNFFTPEAKHTDYKELNKIPGNKIGLLLASLSFHLYLLRLVLLLPSLTIIIGIGSFALGYASLWSIVFPNKRALMI
jgi:hypothetical protein